MALRARKVCGAFEKRAPGAREESLSLLSGDEKENEVELAGLC